MRSALGLLALALLLGLGGLWFVLQGDDVLAAGGPAPALSVGDGARGSTSVTGGEEGRGAPGRVELAPPVTEDLPGQATEVPDDLPRLIGRLVDERGAPIDGGQVIASTGAGWMRPPLDMEDDGIGQGWIKLARTETNVAGRFDLDEPLQPGPLRLAFRAHGRSPRYMNDLQLGEQRPHDLGDVVLSPGITLSGRVLDRSGKGIAGVQFLQAIERGVAGQTLSVPGRGVPLGESRADGSFQVSGLAPGPWRLILDSPEHQVREEEGRLDQPGEQKSLLFVLEGGDDITGRVVGLDPARLAGARVDARIMDKERGREDVILHPRARRALVDSSGHFRVAGLVPGVAHRLTLWERDDEGRQERARDVPAVETWPGSRDVLLEAEPRASLTCKVIDAATGAPVEDFVIFAGVGSGNRDRSRPLQGDDDQALRHHPGGVAVFEGLRPPETGGVASVRIVAPGYEDLERSGIPITRDEAKDLGELALEGGPTVRVRVVCAVDGEPVEGAHVLVATEQNASAVAWLLRSPTSDPWSNAGVRVGLTDAMGETQVSLFPAERCSMAVRAEGFVSSTSEPIPPGQGLQAPIVIELASGGTVDVSVVDARGEPAVGAQVEYARKQQGGQEQVQMRFNNRGGWRGFGNAGEATGAEGRVLLGPLEPATWTIRLASNGGAAEAEPVDVQVVEGGQHKVTLTLPARATVEGVVTQSRLPLAGADLSLSPLNNSAGRGRMRGFGGMGGGSTSALSDHDGSYRMEDVPCGEYRLQVTHQDRYMAEQFEVSVTPGGLVFDIELPLAILEGSVRYEDGRPVPGLRVDVTAADGRRASWRGGGSSLVEDDQGQLQPDWRGRQRRIVTDEDGRYRVVGVASGVELTVATNGTYATPGRLTGIVLAPDEVRADADLEVHAAGRVNLRLAAGTAEGLWRVVMKRQVEEGEKADRRSTQLWGNRARSMDGLEPGEWSIELFAGRGGEQEPVSVQKVQVEAERVSEVVLQVP